MWFDWHLLQPDTTSWGKSFEQCCLNILTLSPFIFTYLPGSKQLSEWSAWLIGQCVGHLVVIKELLDPLVWWLYTQRYQLKENGHKTDNSEIYSDLEYLVWDRNQCKKCRSIIMLNAKPNRNKILNVALIETLIVTPIRTLALRLITVILWPATAGLFFLRVNKRNNLI